MLGSIGLTEILVIAVFLVLLFGGKRIPHFGRDLGQAIKNFMEGIRGEKAADPKELPKEEPPRADEERP